MNEQIADSRAKNAFFNGCKEIFVAFSAVRAFAAREVRSEATYLTGDRCVAAFDAEGF